MKAGILKASMGAGVRQVLSDVGNSLHENRAISEKWAAGDESARKKVDAVLAKAGLTLDEVTAKTLESKIDVFERIDRCWQARRRGQTMAFAKLTVIAKQLARPRAGRSMKSRTLNFATSRRVQLSGEPAS
jgi:hypothetical protein